jgi:cytochrome c-type biogenesis protein CcsB
MNPYLTSSFLLSVVTFVYAVAAVLYIASWVFHKPRLSVVGMITTLAAFLGNTAGIGLRWMESYMLGVGHAPLSNLYESLIFFAWSIALIYLLIEYRYKTKVLGAFATPIAFLALAYASSPKVGDSIEPLLPALKSNWLIAHVITCFLGYAGFAIAFGVSIMYLLKNRDKAENSRLLSRLPRLSVLDELTHQTVMFGFLFLTIGIITGSVWANQAWGSYWSWDPKETWSLITWFVYAILLHARLVRGWRGKGIAYISLAGFTAVLFTYFGVNYLEGLHSYAK